MTHYQIDGVCVNPRCFSPSFSTLRRVGNSNDMPYRVSKVLCPTCRTMANIIRVEEIPGKQEAA